MPGARKSNSSKSAQPDRNGDSKLRRQDLPRTTPRTPRNETLQELLACLTKTQLQFIAAMQTCRTKKDAAAAIRVEPNTVYKWPAYVDEVLQLIAQDSVATALLMLDQNLVKAVGVKLEGLNSGDQVLQQKTASEVIMLGLNKLVAKTQPQSIPKQ